MYDAVFAIKSHKPSKHENEIVFKAMWGLVKNPPFTLNLLLNMNTVLRKSVRPIHLTLRLPLVYFICIPGSSRSLYYTVFLYNSALTTPITLPNNQITIHEDRLKGFFLSGTEEQSLYKYCTKPVYFLHSIQMYFSSSERPYLD